MHEATRHDAQHLLASFSLPSVPGNERLAMEQVAAVVQTFAGERALSAKRLERLKTAVAEATMNAMEHGNHYRPELTVVIQVLAGDDSLVVRIIDHGGSEPIPDLESPDLEAKLAGLQTPRGWGLFLIKNMVDDLHIICDGACHTVELMMHLKGDDHGRETT